MQQSKTVEALQNIADGLQRFSGSVGAGVGALAGGTAAGSAMGAGAFTMVGKLISKPLTMVADKLDKSKIEEEQSNKKQETKLSSISDLMKTMNDTAASLEKKWEEVGDKTLSAIEKNGALAGAGLAAVMSKGSPLAMALGGLAGKGLGMLSGAALKSRENSRTEGDAEVVEKLVEIEQKLPSAETQDERHRDEMEAAKQNTEGPVEKGAKPPQSMLGKLFGGLLGGFTKAMNGIGAFIMKFVGGLKFLLKRIPFLVAIYGTIKGIMSGIEAFQKDLASGGDLISATLSSLKGFAAGFFDSIFGGIADLLDWATGDQYDIRGGFDKLVNWFSEKFQFLIDGWGAISTKVQDMIDFFSGDNAMGAMDSDTILKDSIKAELDKEAADISQKDKDKAIEKFKSTGISGNKIFGLGDDLMDEAKLKKLSVPELRHLYKVGDWSDSEKEVIADAIFSKGTAPRGEIAENAKTQQQRQRNAKLNTASRMYDAGVNVANTSVTNNTNNVVSKGSSKVGNYSATAKNQKISGTVEDRTAYSM